MSHSSLPETLLQDVRHALRVWRKRPLVALVAILTIALGAGMNVAVFELIWTVMLKPLPYADGGLLAQVWIRDDSNERTSPKNDVIERWREASHTFTQLASYRPWRMTVVSGGEPEQVFGAVVSPEFFETLGTPLLAGRAFLPEEIREGADNVTLLREGYWRRRFAGRSAILGSEVNIDGTLCRVIGIVPDSFHAAPLIQGVRLGAGSRGGINAEPEVYLPVSRARIAGFRSGVGASYVVGRLHPAAGLDQAAGELASITAEQESRPVWLSPLQAEIAHRLRPALLALLAATGCVLLIACANLANLLLAQAVMRRRELAVRAALGAGRARMVRQLVTEAAALSMAGAAVGIASAQVVLRLVTALYPDVIPRAAEGGSAWLVYTFAFGVTVLSVMVCGVLPAWRATGEAGEQALRVGTLWMSRGSRRWADTLVTVQIALTAVVLVAAGLLLKSFWVLSEVDLGFARENVITASVNLPQARFENREDRARFGAEWLERLSAIPGVSAAGISISLPLRYTTLLNLTVRVPGESEEQVVGGRAVGGAYFEAMGMEWVAGGPFDENRPNERVVNEAFARRFFNGRSAVGATIGAGDQPLTISGVVRDVRQIGLREEAQPEMFLPFSRFPLNPIDTVVRSPLPPAQVAAALRRELRAVDPELAIWQVMTMNEVVDEQLARPRFQAVLLGLFAAVAMVLAAVGAYGVIAHSVRNRVPEFGLRRALGAGTFDLWRLVLWSGMKAPLTGLGVGLLLSAFAVGRYLESLLFGVVPRDPQVLLVTAGLLAATALLACVLPGRWAAKVEPGQALRQE